MRNNQVKVTLSILIFLFLMSWFVNWNKVSAESKIFKLAFDSEKISVKKYANYTVSILATPSADTFLRGYELRVNFDKSKTLVESIEYSVGTVSVDIGDTNSQIEQINKRGFIKITGETQSAEGYALSSLNDTAIAKLIFKNVNDLPSVVSFSNSHIYTINPDSTLFSDWTYINKDLKIEGQPLSLIEKLKTFVNSINSRFFKLFIH